MIITAQHLSEQWFSERESILRETISIAKKHGCKVRIFKRNTNKMTVKFYTANGPIWNVWFPLEGRVNDVDVQDMLVVQKLLRTGEFNNAEAVRNWKI